MNMIVKTSMAVALAGALSLAALSPSEARNGRGWAAAGVGLAAGAIIGAAAANANGYNNGYYGQRSYGYAPSYGYAEEPDYAYEPAPAYYAPRYAPVYGGNISSPNYNPYVCSTDEGYGRRGSCDAR